MNASPGKAKMTAQGDAGKKKREPAPRETLVRYGGEKRAAAARFESRGRTEGRTRGGKYKSASLKTNGRGFCARPRRTALICQAVLMIDRHTNRSDVLSAF